MVGKRTQQNADLLLDRVKDVTDEHIPFFTSDQLPEYDEALLHTYGVWVQPERKGARGRYPLPRLVPTEDLLYAQVVKVRENGRVTEVKTKVIFGKPETIALQLANSSVSDTLNTSFVERDNGAKAPQSPAHTPHQWLFQRNPLVRKATLALPGLLPLCLATSQLTSTAGGARTHSWHGNSKAVETGHPSDGSRPHRSCLDDLRLAILPPASSILGSIVNDQTLVCLTAQNPSSQMRDTTTEIPEEPKIVNGKLLHADETKIDLIGKEGFVWVVTNIEEVAYFYTETREGDTIQAMLQGFKGVLVSDFYAASDAI